MASNSTVNATQSVFDEQCKRDALFVHDLSSGGAFTASVKLIIYITVILILTAWGLARKAQDSLHSYSYSGARRSNSRPKKRFAFFTTFLALTSFHALLIVLFVQACGYRTNSYNNLRHYIPLYVINTLVTGAALGTIVAMLFQALQVVRRKECELPWYWFIKIEVYVVFSALFLMTAVALLIVMDPKIFSRLNGGQKIRRYWT